MAASCSRRKRRLREPKNKNERHFSITPSTLMICSLALLGAFLFRFEAPMRGEDISPSSSFLKRCNSSCEKILQSTSSDISSPLASSAVDALMLIRDESNNEQDRRRRRNSSQNGDTSPLQSTPRPKRLPPLIETLVGTVDVSLYENTIEKRTQGDESITAARNNGNAVAFAAAAAAAAVWSETRGRHRMKTLNDEWEGALRWIAEWGSDYNSEYGKQRHQRKWGAHQNRRGKMGQYNKMGNNQGELSSANRGVKEFSSVSMFLDSCVNQCIDEYEGKTAHRGHEGEGINHHATNQGVYSWLKVTRIMDSLLLPLPITGRKDAVLVYLFRFVFSAFCFSAIRTGILMWLDNSSDQMPQWLAEELEGDHHDWIKVPQQDQQKKHGGKKGRRRKAFHRRDCTNVEKKSTSPAKELPDVITVLNIEESQRVLVNHSDASKNNHCYKATFVNKEQTSRYDVVEAADTFHRKTSVIHIHKSKSQCSLSQCSEEEINDKGSKREFTSCSPLETDHKYLSFETCQPTGVNSSIPISHVSDKAIVAEANDSIETPLPTETRKSSLCAKPMQAKEQNKNHDFETSHPMKERGDIFISALPTRNLSPVDIPKRESPLRLNGLPIPTNEQREEASRRLREYQSAQVAKILRKRTQESLFSSKETGYKVWSYAKAACVPVTAIPPPPGLAWPSDKINNLSSHNSEDYLAGDELLLSNMLEDDEEDCPSETTQQTSRSLSTEGGSYDGTPIGGVSIGSWAKQSLHIKMQNGSGGEPISLGLFEHKRELGGNNPDPWNQNNSTSVIATTTSWGSCDCSGNSTYDGSMW